MWWYDVNVGLGRTASYLLVHVMVTRLSLYLQGLGHTAIVAFRINGILVGDRTLNHLNTKVELNLSTATASNYNYCRCKCSI